MDVTPFSQLNDNVSSGNLEIPPKEGGLSLMNDNLI